MHLQAFQTLKYKLGPSANARVACAQLDKEDLVHLKIARSSDSTGNVILFSFFIVFEQQHRNLYFAVVVDAFSKLIPNFRDLLIEHANSANRDMQFAGIVKTDG